MKKELKDTSKDREINALRHQVSVKDKHIKTLNADIQIKDAQIQSASMFINYMAACFNSDTDNEVKIKLEDLYQYATGYETSWKKDDEAGVIIIKTMKKGEKQNE